LAEVAEEQVLLIDSDINRKRKIAKMFPGAVAQLGETHPGISLVGLPKGIRSDASVTVHVMPKPDKD
jgi:hypothetical protein